MEPLCEYCGVVRAVVYCRSDSARLCLQCDGRVHSANALARRHQRSLICDRCNSQPATMRCTDDDVCMCQSCDWAACSSNLSHRCKLLFPYAGVPSPADFTSMWSAVLDADVVPIPPDHPLPPPHATHNNEPYIYSNNNNSNNWASCPAAADPNNTNNQNNNNHSNQGFVASRLNELASCLKFDPSSSWVNSSQPSGSRDQTPFSTGAAAEETSCRLMNKGCDNDVELCEGAVDTAEKDVSLSFSGYDEMFAAAAGQCHRGFNGGDEGLAAYLVIGTTRAHGGLFRVD
ncbi:hypothetical protein DM860_006035 [Cuscuta australis]|uniref:B box-type domain-containing protein n=1 Tax=Cuscuta australis TaxID=267555 RepID=A0A328DNW3_9ASTE|nr:hypothetical protein DM860_006035 [Cuscuta australis]